VHLEGLGGVQGKGASDRHASTKVKMHEMTRILTCYVANRNTVDIVENNIETSSKYA
jgi:hypothetical protein